MTTLGMTREYKEREWMKFFLTAPPIHNCLLEVINDFTLISTLEAGRMYEGGTCPLEPTGPVQENSGTERINAY